MTIKEYFANKFPSIECEVRGKKAATVMIVFETNVNDMDSTEFSVEYPIVRSELAELFSTFCNENGFPNDTVKNIIIRNAAATVEELELL